MIPRLCRVRLSLLRTVGFFLLMTTATGAPAKDTAQRPDTPAGRKTLTLASTTSTLDSGLLDALIPPFEKKYGCRVKIIAVGSGQAIRLARDGNADVLLTHDRAAEEKFVADGFGEKRFDVMHNDFVVVGPAKDAAGVKNTAAAATFRRIAKSGAVFVSRGDDSGTHKKELSLWKAAGANPPHGRYIESGSGMEVTLRIADEKSAYTLTDRSTWLAHKKENPSLAVVCEGDKILHNPYSVIAVSAAKYPDTNAALAKRFINFVTGPEGQKIIKNFGADKFGEPLFFPDVMK